MIRYWGKRFQTTLQEDNEIQVIKQELKDLIKKKFGGSLAIRMVDSGSCNACEAECNALSNPYYNLEELGIHFVASPRHADVMFLSGVMTFNMYHHVIDCYNQIPAPKYIIAIGDCVKNLGVFEKTYAIRGNDLPITHYILGCPPSPKEILKGLLEFAKKV